MRAFDLSPLLRSSIGFDHFNRLLDMAQRVEEAPNYPPYNIEKRGADQYRITMAVAGFSQSDLSVTVEHNSLTVTGVAKPEEGAQGEGEELRYLHRGIARRAFERRFELADTIKVSGARLEDGLLHIDLARVIPDAMKPRQIAIETAKDAKARHTIIEGDKAA